jgi:tetratricopeptide (TPR) repeat protein
MDAWNNLGLVFFKQGRNDEAAAIFAKGLAVQPQHLNLLSNDAELALAQGDIARLQTRVDAALPQVTRKDELFVILRFLTWLANPEQSWATVMTAIGQLEPGVKFTWDFSDTRRAITHLDMSTQQTAQHFIDFFEDKIDLATLQTHLSSN